MISSAFLPLKHRFIYLKQVAFWARRDAENKFKVPFDHLKKPFLDFTKVVIWAGQEAENEF